MAGGQPTKMTPETVKVLEEAFMLGCSDQEACFCAGISKQTLYNYQAKHPEYVDRKEVLKQNPFYLARRVTVDALLDNDRAMASKVLDRKEGSKLALTAAVQVTIAGKDAEV